MNYNEIQGGQAVSEPINDGGPAFPTPAGIQHNDGMTLRDYFAAAALKGLMASRNFLDEYDGPYVYQIADAMLKAREAK
jgi:hypothetical protein